MQDLILTRFRTAVAETYGPRLEPIVLFGSRARGDFGPESDYDVAIFLHEMGDLWDELRPLAALTTDILVDTGALISAKPFRAGSYNEERPIMQEIRRDGLDFGWMPRSTLGKPGLLAGGRHMLTGGFNEAAGREAYLAAFHAALAYILLQTGKRSKTHSGTRSEFARPARQDPRVGSAHVHFLVRPTS